MGFETAVSMPPPLRKRAKTGAHFDTSWTSAEETQLEALSTPVRIQDFLDSLAYDTEDGGRSVRSTLALKTAHCLGGSLLAAHCLERHGFGPARIVALGAENDDSHCIAVFQRNGLWGALAKSNTTLLRSRDPVYPNIRCLVLSYFDFYINSNGAKTLRYFVGPLRLAKFDKASRGNGAWLWSNEKVDALDDEEQYWPSRVELLQGVDRANLMEKPEGNGVHQACFLGSNPDGLFKPGGKKKRQ